ncbi:MAG: alpha/beta hydrolase [Pseudomonadota bacterium]
MSFLRSALAFAGFVMLAGCSGGAELPDDVTQSPYFGSDDRIVDLDGQTIRVRESGPSDAQSIILLHGFTDSLHTWEGLVEELNQDFRVIRPDLPGHGLSGPDPEGDYSNEALVTFVADLITETGAETPVLVGNSLGGLAAWRFAATQPDAVKGLVLLAPGGVPHNGVTDVPAEVPAMLRFYLNNAPKAGVQAAMEAMYGDASKLTEDRVNEYRDLMAGQGAAFVARAAQFALPDPQDDMQNVTAPTLILWGSEDRVLPPAHADMFVDSMPEAELIALEGVGHLPHAEVPDAVIDAIRRVANIEEAAP